MSRCRESLVNGLKICYIDLQHDEHSSRCRPGSGGERRDRLAGRERSRQRSLRDARARRASHAGAPLRTAGPPGCNRRDRPAAPGLRESDLPRPRAGDGEPRHRGRLRVDPLLEGGGLVAHGEFTVEGGRAALRELLRSAQRPTGVICSSDLMAVGVLQEAAAQGIRVPEELSVVGFDGIDATRWTNPALTTVEQPIEEIAETAVSALKSLIEEPRK